MGAERRGAELKHRRIRGRHLIGAGLVAGASLIAAAVVGVAVAGVSMNEAGMKAAEMNAAGSLPGKHMMTTQAVPMQPPEAHGTPQKNLPGITVPKPAHMPSNPQRAAMVKRGRYLVIAGDCAACHSVPGGPPFAGGQAIPTPFGSLYSPNITPDRKYGIGGWSDEQFWKLMHNGVAPGWALAVFPRYVYPVMPYAAYSHLNRYDVMAIKAYLETLKPVHEPNRANRLRFPFNVRAGLMVWQMLFFHPHPMHYNKSWTKSERHGAFLVTALEHCSLCHTPRTTFMASETAHHYLAGGHIIGQSWYAPNISSSKSEGIGGWSKQQLVDYLTGGDMTHGVAFGPMQSVVFDSLSRLPKQDVEDIADYILHTTKPMSHPLPSRLTPAERKASVTRGAAIYATDCSHCHGDHGEGVSGNIPNLAHNEAISDGKPDDAISMVLGGFTPWHVTQTPMPGFRTRLSARQIADVVNYIRNSWGNHARVDATPGKVGGLAESAHDKLELDSANSSVTLAESGGRSAGHYRLISGSLDMSSDLDTCLLQTDFREGVDGAPAMHYAGSCIKNGTTLRGYLTVNGRTRQVTMAVTDRIRDHQLVGMHLQTTIDAANWGMRTAQGPMIRLTDDIAVVTPLQ